MTKTVFSNSTIHPAIIQGHARKNKLMKNLKMPNREDYDREARYIAAVEKHQTFMRRIVKILTIIVREWTRTVELSKWHQNNSNIEFVHTICLTKLYCIAAGGGKHVPRSADDPELRVVPNSSTHNDVVKMLVECFFEQRLRGNNRNGSSKWAVKHVPSFPQEVIILLLEIYNQNKTQFDIIMDFLKRNQEEEDELFEEDEFVFEIHQSVEEPLFEQLRQLLT